jgi:sortase (surface protein transpeptidase)
VVLAAANTPDTARPLRVTIPAIGVDSDLAELGVDAQGALVPPVDFAQAGWFAAGPVPGDVGPAVLAGHVDSYRGPAVFFRLEELRPGDRVRVERSDGRTVEFAVTRVAEYPKDRFATGEVYGPTADAQLRLVTCGGAFDRSRRSYLDNVVVFARLA